MALGSEAALRLASIWSYLACASSVSARGGEPLVAGRQLLVADHRVLGADEIVLRLVDRQRVLGVAKPFLQFLQPAGEVGGGAPRGGGL